jgi:hypothetical protein
VNILRTLWRRIVPSSAGDQVSPRFSYRIYWAKTSLSWTPEVREQVLDELREVIAAPSFERNPYRRVYTIPALAGGKYSGESLACLKEVLEALVQPAEGRSGDT